MKQKILTAISFGMVLSMILTGCGNANTPQPKDSAGEGAFVMVFNKTAELHLSRKMRGTADREIVIGKVNDEV